MKPRRKGKGGRQALVKIALLPQEFPAGYEIKNNHCSYIDRDNKRSSVP